MKLIITALCLLVMTSFAFSQKNEKTKAKAIVYIYAESANPTLGRVRPGVYLNDDLIAQIRPEHYFIAVIEPGEHVFRFKSKKYGGIKMEFEPGKTYYLRVTWQSGGTVKPSGLEKVEEESGSYNISQLESVDEKNIKNKLIAFTSLEVNE